MNARNRIVSIIRKEFIHISRDFRTLVIVIVMPVVMLFLYGFAINPMFAMIYVIHAGLIIAYGLFLFGGPREIEADQSGRLR